MECLFKIYYNLLGERIYKKNTTAPAHTNFVIIQAIGILNDFSHHFGGMN